MKKLLAAAFLVLLLALAFAQAPAPAPSPVQSLGEGAPFELAKDWRVLSIGLTFLTVLLIAFAAMVAHSFDMPELKAWASTELGQVFATMFIVLAFAATMLFIDTMLVGIINDSKLPGVSCVNTPNCAVVVADKYIEGMIDIAKEASLTVIKDSNAKAAAAYRSYGGYFTPFFIGPVPVLQASLSFSTSAGNLMHIERYGVVLEYLGNLLSVLYSQKFFVDVVSFKIAPVILMIGIVARSFFVTRRLGGLLMAVGIGVMYVFPLMYVFNWITLNITIFGDSAIDPPSGACPAACLLKPPKYFTDGPFAPSGPGSAAENGKISTKDDLIKYLAAVGLPSDSVVAASQVAHPSGAVTSSTKTVEAHVNDFDLATPVIPATETTLESGGVPMVKQKIFTSNNARVTSCDANSVAFAVFGVPIVVGCPIECRELPYPITQVCKDSVVACTALDNRCKLYRYVNRANPYAVDVYNDNNRGNGRGWECPIVCRSVVPLNTNCNTVGRTPEGYDIRCQQAPDYCRFTRRADSNPNTVNAQERPDNCDANATLCPQGVIAPAPITSATPPQSCVWILPSRKSIKDGVCDDCLFVPEEYTFYPAVFRSCGDVCNPNPSGPPKISPSEFTRRTKEGMVGREEIKTTSALILPAYILPILNIVVTLMFIRSFSQILGGDVEIPGLAKIL